MAESDSEDDEEAYQKEIAEEKAKLEVASLPQLSSFPPSSSHLLAVLPLPTPCHPFSLLIAFCGVDIEQPRAHMRIHT